jgi:prepilin peptidase CpaA
MFSQLTIASLILLVPLAVIITYTDVRYRRIPNVYVLATLISGLVLNGVFGGPRGLLLSLGGCAAAFVLMFVLHVFGAMGAGDVKLFAAIGSVVGLPLVLPTFVIVLITGFALAVYSMIRARLVRTTLLRVLLFFASWFPGWEAPRFAAPADRRHTIPYGVAITFGSLISLFVSRA